MDATKRWEDFVCSVMFGPGVHLVHVRDGEAHRIQHVERLGLRLAVLDVGPTGALPGDRVKGRRVVVLPAPTWVTP